jgi:hypothetical protein
VNLAILKKVLAEVTLEQHPLMTWVLIAKISDEIMLGVDVLWACDVSVDLGHHVL